MVKNLQDYLKTGRDPAYLKNGDTITEELARELVCQGDEDGCLDGEFEITQSRIVEDIVGGEGIYETIWRESPDHPWTYIGLCKAGMDKNLAPIHAKMTYVCSKYRAKNEVEMQQHIMDAMEACRAVHERGDIPVAPLLAKIPGRRKSGRQRLRTAGRNGSSEAMRPDGRDHQTGRTRRRMDQSGNAG